jgi:hypothetical protein
MATLGIYNKNYISTLDPMLDTREIRKQVTDIYNEDALTDILDLAGLKEVIPTGQSVYYNWVTESIFKSVTVSSITSGDVSTQLVIVLTSGTSGYIKVQDMLKFPDNNVGIVSAVSTASGVDTITVKSVAGANINTANGEILSIFSVAMGEKSDAPEAMRFGVSKFSNKWQIFSTSSEISDVQGAATVEFEVNGSNKVAPRDHYIKQLELKGKVNAALFGGDMSVTTFSDSNAFLTDANIVTGGGGGGNVQTTRGVDKFIELYGVTLNAGSGSYTIGAVDDALDNLIAIRAPKEQLVIGGKAARRKVDTFWKSLGSSGINSVRLVVNGKELDLEVDKVSYGGFELNYMTMEILDHPVLFKQTVIAKSLYYLPYNKQVKLEGGGSAQALRTRYIPNQAPFGNEMIGESYDGALNPVNPVGQEQTWKTSWITRQGLEFLGPQLAVRQQVL